MWKMLGMFEMIFGGDTGELKLMSDSEGSDPSFILDLDAFCEGKIPSLNPNCTEDNLIYFVVPQSNKSNRCWPVMADTADRIILYSTVDGDLKMHLSVKETKYNPLFKFWTGHHECIQKLVTELVQEEQTLMDANSSVWSEKYNPIAMTGCKTWRDCKGNMQKMYLLPANSPPLFYSHSYSYKTTGYFAPVIDRKWDIPANEMRYIAFGRKRVDLSSFATKSLGEALCNAKSSCDWKRIASKQKYRSLSIHAGELYSLGRFRRVQGAVILPEMCIAIRDMVQFSPWKIWPEILMYFRKQPGHNPHCCILMEMLGLSTGTVWGEYVIDLSDHHSQDVRSLQIDGEPELIHGMDRGVHRELKNGKHCFQRTDPDGIVSFFDSTSKPQDDTQQFEAVYESQKNRSLALEEDRLFSNLKENMGRPVMDT